MKIEDLETILDKKIEDRESLIRDKGTSMSIILKCQHQLQVLLEIKKELEAI